MPTNGLLAASRPVAASSLSACVLAFQWLAGPAFRVGMNALVAVLPRSRRPTSTFRFCLAYPCWIARSTVSRLAFSSEQNTFALNPLTVEGFSC